MIENESMKHKFVNFADAMTIYANGERNDTRCQDNIKRKELCRSSIMDLKEKQKERQ